MTPAELAVQLADRCFDDARLPSTLRALHQRAADAERRGLGEDDVFHLVHVGRSAEDAQQHTGAILFHLDRRRENFDRAGLEQFLFRVADDLRRDIVQIGFELEDLIGFGQRRALANEQPQEVGSIGKVAAAGSVADRFDSHRRQGRVPCDERFQNRRAGRRGQFGIDWQIDQRDAFEQLGRAGSGNRADAVSDLDASASRRHRTRNNFVDAEEIKPNRHADDVHNRVNRADFVEMNLVERCPMHAGFRLGNVLEDFQRELLLRLGQLFGSLDQLGDVGKVPVSVLFRVLDFDLQRSEAPFDHRLDVQLDVRQAERINPAHDLFEVGSGVDQCRQSHVATDAANAVEVRNPHDEILVVEGQSERRRILVLVQSPTNGSWQNERFGITADSHQPSAFGRTRPDLQSSRLSSPSERKPDPTAFCFCGTNIVSDASGTSSPVDLPRIERAVREILAAVGEDPNREGLLDTPKRVARMYAELFSGLHSEPARHLQKVFTEDYDELVLVRDITFNSMCEHHLLPFIGKAHVGYLPNGKIAGLSKLARVVDEVSRRPQVQERMTHTIAELLHKELDAKGVVVVLEAEHSCMSIRGVKKAGSITITSAVRGLFLTNQSSRAEVMSLINRR